MFFQFKARVIGRVKKTQSYSVIFELPQHLKAWIKDDIRKAIGPIIGVKG